MTLLYRQWGHVVFQLLGLGEVLMHLEGSCSALILDPVSTKVALAVILCGWCYMQTQAWSHLLWDVQGCPLGQLSWISPDIMAATPVVPLTTARWESAEEGRT